MRTMHGSMMDAAGARPGDLAQAQRRMLTAALPDAQHPRRAPLPLLPFARALAVESLFKHVASQSAQAFQAATALPALPFDAAGVQQAVALTEAMVKQWQTLQAHWMDGLTELAQEMGEIRQANTVSKYVDQEMNLVQQSLALVSNHATATARLIENTQVNIAWWLSQRSAAGA